MLARLLPASSDADRLYTSLPAEFGAMMPCPSLSCKPDSIRSQSARCHEASLGVGADLERLEGDQLSEMLFAT
jgi:hypothetical protein